MTRYSVWFLVLTVVACNDQKPEVKIRVDREVIFLDYRISGSEESGEATVRLQLFEGDENGRTLRLHPPAAVELDGTPLTGDSSRMNGFYYESRFSVDDFEGEHEIVFRNSDGAAHKTAFDFKRLVLKHDLPGQVGRKEHWFHLSGVEAGNVVRMLLIDTAFYSRGVDRVDTVRGDSVSLTPRDFENLRNGPVYLEILQEKEMPISDDSMKINGRLSVVYTLKRAFQLRD
jgi:hypothetical protein